MLRHIDAIANAVRRPGLRLKDPRPGREQFYRRDLDPERWLRVVADFSEVPGFVVAGNVIGMVLLNVPWTLERDGAITLTWPAERLDANQLAPALSAA